MSFIGESLMGKLFSKRKKSAGSSRPTSARVQGHGDEMGHDVSGGAINNWGGGMGDVTPLHSDAVVSVSVVSPGLCVSGSKDCKVVLYDYKNRKCLEKWEGHASAVTKVLYGSCCDSVFSSSRDKTIQVWKRGHSQSIQSYNGHNLVVTAIHLNDDNSLLCSGSRDNSVRLWDVHTGACLRSNTIPQNLVTDVKFVPGTSLIVQTGEDKEVRVFDKRNLEPVFSFPKKQYIQMCCDISPDGNYIVSSSNGFQGNGCEATLWDLRSRVLQKEFKGHREAVEACMFLKTTSQQPLVVTASRDCSVKTWDMTTGGCLHECFVSGSGPLTSLAADSDCSLLVGSFNQGVQVFRSDNSSVYKQFHY